MSVHFNVNTLHLQTGPDMRRVRGAIAPGHRFSDAPTKSHFTEKVVQKETDLI